MNGDEVNEGEEETVTPATPIVAPTSPYPCSNSITCISHNTTNTSAYY